MNGNTDRHNTPFLESASLKETKRESVLSDKKTAKLSKKWNSNIYICKKKKFIKRKISFNLVPKSVIDLPFEGSKVEGSQKNRKYKLIVR